MNFPFTINNHIAIASEMMGMRLKLNPENYQLLKELCYEEWEKCKSEVSRVAGKEINVSSDKDVHRLLYSELQLKAKVNRKTGRPTADENALRELRVQYPQHKELLNALIKERHIKKKIESYIEFKIDGDGYIPYSANPAGTETNRWSFSKSPQNKGFNVQTAPKIMRIMVDAPPGRVYICPDLPQADARIVAWDARCERLIELFLNPNVHFHLENCIRLFGIPREEAYDPKFKSEDPRYTVGKSMGHAANYGMASGKLAMELGIPKVEAQRLLDIYLHRLYPEIERWHVDIKNRIKRHGGLTTPYPFQRQRVFYGAWAEYLLRGKISQTSLNEAYAYIPQSVVADIINVGMERLWDGLDYVRFHKHDHDSYLASVPSDRLGHAVEFALDKLRVELRIHDRPLVMVPEMSVGYNYGLMREWKGEAELKFDEWQEWAQKKLDREKIRKDLYGYY